MAWFKVDDKLHSHKKTARAGVAAMGLWLLAGSWSMDHLTDGFIPDYIAPRLDPNAEESASLLVRAGLWHPAERDGDKGWQFHDWAEHQPTRNEVESKREYERERKRKQRRGPSGQFEESPQVSRRDSAGTSSAVPSGVTPSRPVPSRPDPDTPNGVSSTARNTRLSDDWTPTDEHHRRARDTGLDIDTEVQKFVSHAHEKDRRAKNWNAAFTRWLINAAEYARRDREAGTSDRQARILRSEMEQARLWDAKNSRKEIGA